MWKLLEWADIETFEVIYETPNERISRNYAKDKNNIYFYDWKKLEWVDLETFEVFGDRWWEVY